MGQVQFWLSLIQCIFELVQREHNKGIQVVHGIVVAGTLPISPFHTFEKNTLNYNLKIELNHFVSWNEIPWIKIKTALAFQEMII